MTSQPAIRLDGDAVVWSEPHDGQRPIAVMLHGMYGHESDWSSRFDALPVGVVGASLRAPVPYHGRWAWADFHQDPRVAAWTAAARGLVAWIDALPPVPIVLVGWSQGAAVSVHALRQRPARFAGVVLLGGFVIERRPHAGVAAARPPAFFGIGADDDVIGRSRAASARDWLDAHTRLTGREYAGVGHDLTAEMVTDAMRAVRAQLADG